MHFQLHNCIKDWIGERVMGFAHFVSAWRWQSE